MVSNKEFIQRLVKVCELKEIKHVVFSPGSRNAPLVISFDENPHFECITIPDERVAGFFAMGMALHLNEPVIICCTSGSAALNYAPAIVEAYYQKIPLLVLTADRPVEWIDQGAGQTMRQKNVYNNYIKGSFELIQEAQHLQDLRHNDRMVCEAINLANHPCKGPIHINVPLSEPLYDVVEAKEFDNLQMVEAHPSDFSIREKERGSIREIWKNAKRKLIIFGQSKPNRQTDVLLEEVAQDPSVAIISETCSNRYVTPYNPCIDRLITTIAEDELELYKPDIVVSLGDAIISKKIKAMIRKYHPKEHWYVNEQKQAQDTFLALTKHIRSSELSFLSVVNDLKTESTFSSTWHCKHLETKQRHKEFIDTCSWSDLLAFHHILKEVPVNSDLHLGNSSPIRYTQLFDQRQNVNYFCNRGVSGIDGSTSTSAGAAYASNRLTTMVTGDMAFFYDSNALWNHHLPNNLRIVMVNNGGGGIFKIIPGPKTTNQYKKYFATEQQFSADHIAKAFGCPYYKVDDVHNLVSYLKMFYEESFDKPPILEVMTGHVENDNVLEAYFKYLVK
jgi:2-succinyl-5-enolpyruvyl-6-hydroxy-3-cyclohexene-1-carboxylate synthase